MGTPYHLDFRGRGRAEAQRLLAHLLFKLFEVVRVEGEHPTPSRTVPEQ